MFIMFELNLSSIAGAVGVVPSSNTKASEVKKQDVNVNTSPKTDSVKISDTAQEDIKVPDAVEFSDIDFDDNPEVIDYLRQEHPNLQVSKNKEGKTKISFSNDKYEYTICNNETLVRNKQTGQMQLFHKSTIRSDYGLHVINYNSKGLPESYQRFDLDGKHGDEIIKFNPDDIAKGLKPTLTGITGMMLTDSPEYLGHNVDID